VATDRVTIRPADPQRDDLQDLHHPVCFRDFVQYNQLMRAKIQRPKLVQNPVSKDWIERRRDKNGPVLQDHRSRRWNAQRGRPTGCPCSEKYNEAQLPGINKVNWYQVHKAGPILVQIWMACRCDRGSFYLGEISECSVYPCKRSS